MAPGQTFPRVPAPSSFMAQVHGLGRASDIGTEATDRRWCHRSSYVCWIVNESTAIAEGGLGAQRRESVHPDDVRRFSGGQFDLLPEIRGSPDCPVLWPLCGSLRLQRNYNGRGSAS
jgi:hypothetical protein